MSVPFVRLSPAARLDNWEGLAGHVLRGQLKRASPRQTFAAYVPRSAVRAADAGQLAGPVLKKDADLLDCHVS